MDVLTPQGESSRNVYIWQTIRLYTLNTSHFCWLFLIKAGGKQKGNDYKMASAKLIPTLLSSLPTSGTVLYCELYQSLSFVSFMENLPLAQVQMPQSCIISVSYNPTSPHTFRSIVLTLFPPLHWDCFLKDPFTCISSRNTEPLVRSSTFLQS